MAKKKGGGGGGGKKKASSSKGGVGGSGAEKNAATKRGGKAKKRNGKSKSNHSSTSSSSDDDDDTQFRAQLLNQGHLIREMNSDGNCLFRSLSDQLYNDDGDEHGTVREEICDFLQEHKEEFQSFLLMDEDDEDIMNIDDYVEHMREHMTWGSDIEIVAASRKYDKGIKVFSTHYGVLRFGNHEENHNDNSGDSDLLLSYHGNDHYNSVHLIDGSNRQTRQSKEGGRYPSRRTRKSTTNSNHTAELEEATTTSTATAADNTKKRRASPTKGSPCPCGSGLKYKKCCFAREKAKKRLAKMIDTDTDDLSSSVGGDEKKEEFIGEFKVLNI